MFDLDETLIYGHVERVADSGPEQFKEIQPFSEVRPMPGRLEKIAQLRAAGMGIAICTNKAGVAFGHETEDECNEKALEVSRVFDFGTDVVYLQAFGHKHAKIEKYRFDDPWRKPKPGMLLRAMELFEVEPKEAFYVGDMAADKHAAEAAKVDFAWADAYFGD